MIDRLADDHANARKLAEGISQIDGLTIDTEAVGTNMVYFQLATDRLTSADLVTRAEKHGVKFLALGDIFRMVTHYGIESNDIDRTIDVLAAAMA
jgi:threonine aldolase